MQTLRCKCGKITGWSSMGTPDCQGCEDCKTTLAASPEGHRELMPHDWKIYFNDVTGKPYNICKACGQRDEDSYKESNVENITIGIWKQTMNLRTVMKKIVIFGNPQQQIDVVDYIQQQWINTEGETEWRNIDTIDFKDI